MKFSKKTVKVGTLTLVVTAIVLAVIIALNLLVNELPSSIKSIDTTKEKIFTVSEETKALLKSLDRDVEIYMIVERGYETVVTSTIDELIDQYESESGHIKYKVIDPAVNPAFTEKFTDEKVAPGSVIVSSGARTKIISGNEWYMYDTPEGRLNSSEYSQYQQYYAMLGQSLESNELFLGETFLTGAISYVTSDDAAKIYTLTGHGEQPITSYYASKLDDAGVETENINLISSDGALPDDCRVVMINYPTEDITEDEAASLSDFYNRGGEIILVTYVGYYDEGAEPNLAALASNCGAAASEGMVFDSSPTGYRTYPYNLIPSLSPSAPEALWNDSALTYAIMYAHGIVEAEESDCDFFPILVTSDEAYSKRDVANITTLDYEDGDERGSFCVAAATTKETEGGAAKLVWISSPGFFDQNLDYGGNSSLFNSIIKWSFEGAIKESVPAKVISNDYLTLTEKDVNVWKIVLELVIPAAVIASGVIVWFLRRRKR